MTQHARVGSIWNKMTSTENREVIFRKNECWRTEDVLGFMIGVGSWHIDMTPRDAQDQLRGIRGVSEGRMEIMGQYFMPGLHRNINPGCHCKNKQGHCLHFIAFFLRLQFSWHTIELWIKRTFSFLKFPDYESVMLFISKLKCMQRRFNGGSAEL